VNALPGKKLAARVASVAALSTASSGVVSYDVTFTLTQSAAALKPGMTGSAQVVVSQVAGVVSVPTSAISRRGGGSTVTVVSGGKQVQRDVTTGVTGDSTTEVISGLNAGDQVAVPLPTVTSAAATGAGPGGGGAFRGGGGGAGLGGGGFGGGGGGGGFRFGGGGPGGP
jgi:macrolide-specific efflux system membrane fusion protein